MAVADAIAVRYFAIQIAMDHMVSTCVHQTPAVQVATTIVVLVPTRIGAK